MTTRRARLRLTRFEAFEPPYVTVAVFDDGTRIVYDTDHRESFDALERLALCDGRAVDAMVVEGRAPDGGRLVRLTIDGLPLWFREIVYGPSWVEVREGDGEVPR